MVIIDDTLVSSAINIKRTHEEMLSKLDGYKSQVLELSKYLLTASNDLEKYIQTDMKNVSSVNEATKFVIDKMVEMEVEAERINKLIDPINVSIEKLKLDEIELKLEIQKRNPGASDEDIIKTLFEKMNRSDT